MKPSLTSFAAAVAATAALTSLAAPALAADSTSASLTDKAGDDNAGPKATKAIRASSDILKSTINTSGTKTVVTITLAGAVIKDKVTYSAYRMSGQLSGASKEDLNSSVVFNDGKAAAYGDLSSKAMDCAISGSTKGKVVKITIPDSCLPSGKYTLSSIDVSASAQGETFSQDVATFSGAKLSVK